MPARCKNFDQKFGMNEARVNGGLSSFLLNTEVQFYACSGNGMERHVGPWIMSLGRSVCAIRWYKHFPQSVVSDEWGRNYDIDDNTYIDLISDYDAILFGRSKFVIDHTPFQAAKDNPQLGVLIWFGGLYALAKRFDEIPTNNRTLLMQRVH